MNQKAKLIRNKILRKLVAHVKRTGKSKLLIYTFVVTTFVFGGTVIPQALAVNTTQQEGTIPSLAPNLDYVTVITKNQEQQIAKANDSYQKQLQLKKIEQVSQQTVPPVPEKEVSRGEETFVYNPRVPMPESYQLYLYKMCQERKLDYKETLAVIQAESGFNPSKISQTHDYGYFQVNIVNHKDLAKYLHTPNTPLDPTVNINWGTYMLSELYKKYEAKGLSGTALKDAVLSSYNRGINGYAQSGNENSYIQRNTEAQAQINKLFS